MDVVTPQQKPDKAISAEKGAAAAWRALWPIVALGALDALVAALADPSTLGLLTGPLIKKYPWVIALVPLVAGYNTSRANWKKQKAKTNGQ